jgi:hypothetical protein
MTPGERNIIATHQQEVPVDVTALATALGLSVYESYDLPQGISGMISREGNGESPSGYAITVNAAEAYTRRRFTIAHECAHFLLHREKIGDALSDDAMYRSPNVTTKEEFHANNLAAELVMPRNLMNAAIHRGFAGVRDLAQRFEVSEAAMKVRLRFLYQMADI